QVSGKSKVPFRIPREIEKDDIGNNFSRAGMSMNRNAPFPHGEHESSLLQARSQVGTAPWIHAHYSGRQHHHLFVSILVGDKYPWWRPPCTYEQPHELRGGIKAAWSVAHWNESVKQYFLLAYWRKAREATSDGCAAVESARPSR